MTKKWKPVETFQKICQTNELIIKKTEGETAQIKAWIQAICNQLSERLDICCEIGSLKRFAYSRSTTIWQAGILGLLCCPDM